MSHQAGEIIQVRSNPVLKDNYDLLQLGSSRRRFGHLCVSSDNMVLGQSNMPFFFFFLRLTFLHLIAGKAQEELITLIKAAFQFLAHFSSLDWNTQMERSHLVISYTCFSSCCDKSESESNAWKTSRRGNRIQTNKFITVHSPTSCKAVCAVWKHCLQSGR